MDLLYLEQLIPALKAMGVEFDPGLTDAEILHAENKYGFHFPPDLRMFLQYALPVSEGWPNWREDNEEEIRDQLEWPLEGLCFDIEANNVWMEAWGEKPPYLVEAFRIARKVVRAAPRMIPIRYHRYIPDDPHSAGNPIFSIWQTDTILYGYDLADYCYQEFWNPGRPGRLKNLPQPIRPGWIARSARPIRFWTELMEMGGGGYAGNDFPDEVTIRERTSCD